MIIPFSKKYLCRRNKSGETLPSVETIPHKCKIRGLSYPDAGEILCDGRPKVVVCRFRGRKPCVIILRIMIGLTVRIKM